MWSIQAADAIISSSCQAVLRPTHGLDVAAFVKLGHQHKILRNTGNVHRTKQRVRPHPAAGDVSCFKLFECEAATEAKPSRDTTAACKSETVKSTSVPHRPFQKRAQRTYSALPGVGMDRFILHCLNEHCVSIGKGHFPFSSNRNIWQGVETPCPMARADRPLLHTLETRGLLHNPCRALSWGRKDLELEGLSRQARTCYKPL